MMAELEEDDDIFREIAEALASSSLHEETHISHPASLALLERRLVDADTWLGRMTRIYEPSTSKQRERVRQDAVTGDDATFFSNAKNGAYGIDVGFLCVVCEEFDIPIPTPSNFLGLRGPFPSFVDLGMSPRCHRFESVHEMLAGKFDVKNMAEIRGMDMEQLEKIAASILSLSFQNWNDIFLQAYARVFMTIPAIAYKSLPLEEIRGINDNTPLWYHASPQFSVFLSLCVQALCRGDWRTHVSPLLSAELMRVYETYLK